MRTKGEEAVFRRSGRLLGMAMGMGCLSAHVMAHTGLRRFGGGWSWMDTRLAQTSAAPSPHFTSPRGLQEPEEE